MQKKSRHIDMVSGPILPRLIAYSIPIILSGILQLLYNAAAIVVVGRFVGKTSLAAVGSTSALINLQVNLFVGLAVGARVVIAQYYGAKDERAVKETTHTSILIAIISGLLLTLIGTFCSRYFLELMATPDDVIDLSTEYLKIYFLSMPASLIVNFGSSILGAAGDTKRPMYIMMISGVINVGLNLLLVISFGLGVAGVAIATTVSQYFSAVLILCCLIFTNDYYKLSLKLLRIHWDKLKKILAIGIPAGVQGVIFSISNVIIQSSVNAFGSTVVAGNSAAANVEGFVYTSMNAISQATLTFTGQNVGAHKPKRIKRVYLNSLGLVTVIGLIMGTLVYIFSTPVLSLYTADPSVIRCGQLRLFWICLPYFLCGIMDVSAGALRGMGHSVVPMLVTILGVCGIRIVWIAVVHATGLVDTAQKTSIKWVYVSYMISWAVTFLVHAVCVFFAQRKLQSAEEGIYPGDFDPSDAAFSEAEQNKSKTVSTEA